MARKTTRTPPDAPRAGVRPGRRRSVARQPSSANLGFEAKLWLAADKLRNNMDAAEYKHVVLGLIFLKYISDTFEQHRTKLLAGQGDYAGANAEDQDEYKAENVFWVPREARWSHLQANAKQPTIGKLVDDAMVAIERDNPRLKGVLPKDYARPGLDKHRLGELIDLIGTISLVRSATGKEVARADLPPAAGAGRAEGKLDVAPMPSHRSVDILGRVGVPPKGNANFAWVQHFIHHLAPAGPGTAGGVAGFVLANGSMSSNQSGEGDIRRAIIDADLVDCMVALPGQLFYSTPIPVCLWFVRRDKRRLPSFVGRVWAERGQGCDRMGQTLFIDARKLGTMIDRVHRELTDADIGKIVGTYHAWRQAVPAPNTSAYADVPGFCKSATTAEIAAHGYVLTPGRYVGAEAVEDSGEPFEEKMARLAVELHAQFTESAKLEQVIKANLKGLGYDG